jgi:hypothetical protein
MTKYIADYEVETHMAVINNDLKLKFIHPENLYEIHIRNLYVTPPIETPLLSVQIILDCEDINTVKEKARDYLNAFFDVLSFVTNMKFAIHKLIRIIDWTPGLAMRDCLQFKKFPDTQIPFELLNDDLLETVNKLMDNPVPGAVKRALKWFADGVGEKYLEKQFQYFWFSLEILAEMHKEIKKVPDKCPVCDTPLYCGTCKEIPKHRPFPKQAILELIREVVKGQPEDLFDKLIKSRNALLHGAEINEIEKTINVNFSYLINKLGKIVWVGILNSFEFKKETPLDLLETSNYCHKILMTSLVCRIGSGPDKDNPEIEKIANVQVSMQVSKREIENKNEKKTNGSI